MATFNPQQTVFTLSVLAGLGDSLTGSVGTIEPALTQLLETQLTTLQPQIGTWDLVWGPAVYELPTSDRPDNTMFGVSGGGQLVVAVAGTNPYSVLDWIVEDFLVTPQVPWPTGTPFPQERKISLGTFIGLSVLQTLTPGPGQAGAGVLLKDFLASQVSAPITINVAGHSLGGALSPTLALWLSDTRASWDPAGNATLAVLPSAGPTAGNAAFAQYSDSQIGSQVTRLYNPLDIVPKAWTTSDLQTIPNLYAPDIPPDLFVKGFADLAVDISKNGGYTQINLNAPPLSGSAVNTGIINPLLLPILNFFVQVGYQHVDAYSVLLGTTAALDPVLQTLKASAQVRNPVNELTRLKDRLAKFRLKI
ncbi:MAG TPA: lipase [Thermoanaerobaculia bacterium]|nr:lipase [Thermoanaerobaculia bacterium]